MKITATQLEMTLAKLPEGFNPDMIEQIAGFFPDQIPFSLIQDSIIIIGKREGKDVSAEKMIREIAGQLEAMAPGEPGKHKAGDSKYITDRYFERYCLEWRLLGSVQPKMESCYFGTTFSSPIMTTAMSHLGPVKNSQRDGMYEYALAAAKTNVLHWVGMCENQEFEKLMELGAKTVRIIKPYADDAKVLSQIECCQKTGAIACGMDIDHAFNREGEMDVCMGEEMQQKSLKQLKRYIEAAKMPFVLKGVLSVQDAMRAKELGADAIVISHHNGRMDYAVPPLMVLHDIRDAVGDQLQIFVDCGVKTGMDAYKALALGADGVCVGTELLKSLREGGSDAVADKLKSMTRELSGAMSYTGVKDTKSFDPTVLHAL